MKQRLQIDIAAIGLFPEHDTTDSPRQVQVNEFGALETLVKAQRPRAIALTKPSRLRKRYVWRDDRSRKRVKLDPPAGGHMNRDIGRDRQWIAGDGTPIFMRQMAPATGGYVLNYRGARHRALVNSVGQKPFGIG